MWQGRKNHAEKMVHALVVSTPALLEFIDFLHKLDTRIAGKHDGTFRLTSVGWVVSVLATHWVVHSHESSKHSHHSFALCFMVTFSECKIAFDYHFETDIKIPQTHFNRTGTLSFFNDH